jgi:hypothetical protein
MSPGMAAGLQESVIARTWNFALRKWWALVVALGVSLAYNIGELILTGSLSTFWIRAEQQVYLPLRLSLSMARSEWVKQCSPRWWYGASSKREPFRME